MRHFIVSMGNCCWLLKTAFGRKQLAAGMSHHSNGNWGVKPASSLAIGQKAVGNSERAEGREGEGRREFREVEGRRVFGTEGIEREKKLERENKFIGRGQ